MKVGHDEETDNGGDNAKEFDFFVGGDATSDIIGDFLIKDGNGGAGS